MDQHLGQQKGQSKKRSLEFPSYLRLTAGSSSESTIRGDEAWINVMGGQEGESAGDSQAFQENQPLEAGKEHGDVQSSREHPWCDKDHHPSFAPSSPRPMKRFLNHCHKREFFWIDGKPTGIADLEELDPSTFLPKTGHNNSDKISGSKTITKINKGSTAEPNSEEGKELNETRSMNEQSPMKRRKRE